MNGVVKINKCSVNKVMRVVHDTKNAYSVCLFTANYTKQAEAFPDNIQKYGTTALFKVSSYHLPAKLLGKISFNLEGHWEKDTHGTKGDEKIFVAEKASESMPETRAEIIKFLMNSSKGVGKVTAETIYNKFGDETLDTCAHKPRRLRDIPKMTEQMLGNINAACLSALVRADVQILLGKAELEVSVINQIVEAYGDEATTVLKSEPYKLVRLLGFSTTDHIAMSMGEKPDSERRLRAATIEAQKRTCSKTGNMCAEGSAMLLQLKALVPELSDETIADAVAKTAADYDIVRQGRYYYDKTDFIAERGMAAKVAALANEMPTKEKEIENAFLEWQKENSIILSPRQAEAVKNLKYRISIVTGGPGTGKTTVLKAVIEVFKLLKPSEKILLAAPTGRASRRMAESTGVNNASTLHSLLGLFGEDGGFRKGEEDMLDAGLIIVDESSMMDMWLARKFFSRIGPDTKVLLVGDADQLQSVGAGDVFRELINCGLIPVTVLNEIFRQKKDSLIAYNAQKINNNDTSFFYGNDFTVCKCANQEEAAEHIRNIYLAQVKQYGVDRVQILSPFRSTGAASADQLNEAIRELVNPQTEEADLKVGSLYFRVGDKIMQNKNSTKASNGDIGFIRSFRHDERDGMRISIQFSPTRVVEYSMEEMGHVELAYATTVHKAQGSEFDVVIFPLLRSHARMLTRSLVYTAITRAKAKVILVGQIGMLYMAVHKDDTGKRNTQLGRRITLYVNTFKVQKRSA